MKGGVVQANGDARITITKNMPVAERVNYVQRTALN